MKTIFALLIIGVVLLVYSFTLEPYTDKEVFMSKYMDLAESSRDSEAFWQLREKMLTPKFKTQDYGITLILAAGFLHLLGLIKFRAPSRKWILILLGLSLPIITVSGFVFDLFQGMFRDEFPSWADSLGIPLMGVPIQLLVLFVWSGVHLGFIGSGYKEDVPLRSAISRESNIWLLFVSAVTLLLTALFAFEGAYHYAVPGALWLYYYLSLTAIRRAVNDTQQISLVDAP